MAQTTLRQKFVLIIFGLSLTVILLEIGLRIAGAIVFYLQERHNHLSFSDTEYRILCLGESTTALGGEDSYPGQLERMLNEHSKTKRFTVINKGVIGTNTDYIREHVDQNLDQYKPQLVIVMMGVNDRFYFRPPQGPQWLWQIQLYFKNFRVYKLVNLLYEHITHHIKGTKATPEDNDNLQYGHNYQRTENFLEDLIIGFTKSLQRHITNAQRYKRNNQLPQAQQEYLLAHQAAERISLAYVDLARRYYQRGLLEETQSFLEKAVRFDPLVSDTYEQWGELYLSQGKGQEAIKAFQTAIELDPKDNDYLVGLARAYHQQGDPKAFIVYTEHLNRAPNDYWGYVELAQWFKEKKIYAEAEVNLRHAIELEPYFDRAYFDMEQLLDEQGQYQKEEGFYLKQLSLKPNNPLVFRALGLLYQKEGKEGLAKEYFKKALQWGLSEYRPETLANYDSVLNKVLSRGIPIIVMQYPLRSIDTLKDYLGQKRGVIFVENKQNFKTALQSGTYSDYFKDTFANDFGHCTRKGNELIARNLAGVILKMNNRSF